MIGVTLLILAVFNGFAGYSLLDDQLSGTGLRIAYSIALSIPVVGTWIAFLRVRRRVPGLRHHQPPLRDPRPDPARRSSSVLLDRAPRSSSCATSTRSSPDAGAASTTSSGRADVADVHGQGARAVLLRRSRCCAASAAWCRSTRSGCTARSTRRRCPPRRSPTGTWAGSTARCASCPRWEIRAFGFEIPNPFFPGVLLAGDHVHAAVPVAVPRGAVHRGTTPSITCSIVRASDRCAPRSASAALSFYSRAVPRAASTT